MPRPSFAPAYTGSSDSSGSSDEASLSDSPSGSEYTPSQANAFRETDDPERQALKEVLLARRQELQREIELATKIQAAPPRAETDYWLWDKDIEPQEYHRQAALVAQARDKERREQAETRAALEVVIVPDKQEEKESLLQLQQGGWYAARAVTEAHPPKSVYETFMPTASPADFTQEWTALQPPKREYDEEGSWFYRVLLPDLGWNERYLEDVSNYRQDIETFSLTNRESNALKRALYQDLCTQSCPIFTGLDILDQLEHANFIPVRLRRSQPLLLRPLFQQSWRRPGESNLERPIDWMSAAEISYNAPPVRPSVLRSLREVEDRCTSPASSHVASAVSSNSTSASTFVSAFSSPLERISSDTSAYATESPMLQARKASGDSRGWEVSSEGGKNDANRWERDTDESQPLPTHWHDESEEVPETESQSDSEEFHYPSSPPPIAGPVEHLPGSPAQATAERMSPQSSSDSSYIRMQNDRLRQYSSVVVACARNPWEIVDNPEVREARLAMSPTIEQRYVPGWNLPGDAVKPADNKSERPIQLPPLAPSEAARLSPSCSHDAGPSSYNDSMEDEPSRGSSPGPPPLVRAISPTNRMPSGKVDPQPYSGRTYCDKCRRHFRNETRLFDHLRDSILHPYFCRSCTRDWPSFSMLYTHYAEVKACQPPEMEFGQPGFLQLLADHQKTAHKGKARAIEPDDAPSASIAGTSANLEDQLNSGRRWWHLPPSQLSPPRSLSPEAGMPTIEQAPHSSVVRSNSVVAARMSATTGRNEDDKAQATTTSTNLRKSRQKLEPPTCPICMSILKQKKEILATACGHVYCSTCILHYLSSIKNECPKCRTPLTLTLLIPLYLY